MKEDPGWAGHHQGAIPRKGYRKKGPQGEGHSLFISVTLMTGPGAQEVLEQYLVNE